MIATSANVQFETLKNQLDPHFLFNSLNVLSSLVEENPGRAQTFIDSLSKMYRYILTKRQDELVPLEEEIGFAQRYVELLKFRFEDSFHFENRLTKVKGFVVPLSLQILIENCIKHNLASNSKPLFIKIYNEGDNLIVENNLQNHENNDERIGLGLNNITNQYRLLTERQVKVEKTNKTFRVTLPILKEKLNNMETTKEQERRDYQQAAEHVKDLKGFYGHLIAYLAVNSFLVVLNLLTSPHDIWFIYPLVGWGIGLTIHAFSLFWLGKNWEKHKIEEVLRKNREL